MGSGQEQPAIHQLMAHFEGRLPKGWDEVETCERFLAACNGDAEAAIAMLEGSLTWREEFVEGGVGSLLHFKFPEERAVRDAFPQCFHKSDRLGRPIQYQLVGQANKDKLQAATTEDRLLQWNVHRAEHTFRIKYPACSRAAGTKVGQTVVVIDLEGFEFSNFTGEVRNYLKQYFQLLGANFPGNLAKVYVINTPMLFQPIWAVVRLFLPPRDAERIQLFGGARDYEPVLRADIEESQLPSRYGGSDTSFDTLQDVGTWQQQEQLDLESDSPRSEVDLL